MTAQSDICLAVPQFASRLAALRHSLASKGQDALVIFSLDNLRYLVNYAGEAAYGVLTANSMYLITDYRFVEQAQEECVQCDVVCRDRDRQSLGEAIAVLLESDGARKVLFESEHISVALWQGVAKANPCVGFAASGALIEQQRKQKDAWEVAQIRRAAAIADAALARLLPQLTLGVSERDMALELDYQMQALGAEGLSFATILGFGARSALPHCIPSRRTLQAGDLVLIDFGAVVNGYRSDMTRSYVAGRADARQQGMYDTVFGAQAAALATLRAGLPAQRADAAASAVLQASPFGQYAGPGLGHGVGIKLHEQPYIGPHCTETLQAGYVVTIEPGLYMANYGGVRLEDDVLITDDGYELLTHAPKLFELPL